METQPLLATWLLFWKQLLLYRKKSGENYLGETLYLISFWKFTGAGGRNV